MCGCVSVSVFQHYLLRIVFLIMSLIFSLPISKNGRARVHMYVCLLLLLCFRTSALTMAEVEESRSAIPLLERYFPDQALAIVFGSPNAIRTKATASAFRATQRIPAVSVYCLLPPTHHANNTATIQQSPSSPQMVSETAQQGLLYMLQGSFPCHLYQLQASDFVFPVDDGHSRRGRHPLTKGDDSHRLRSAEQLANVTAMDYLYPGRPSLIVDGGTTLTWTALAPPTTHNDDDVAADQTAAASALPPCNHDTTTSTNEASMGDVVTMEPTTSVLASNTSSSSLAPAGVDERVGAAVVTSPNEMAVEEPFPDDDQKPIAIATTGPVAVGRSKTSFHKKNGTSTTTTKDPAGGSGSSYGPMSVEIVGDCRTLSLSSKLRALHEQTGALPDITSKHVQVFLLELEEHKRDELVLFATDTVHAMLGCVLRETTLLLRSALKQWALSPSPHRFVAGRNPPPLSSLAVVEKDKNGTIIQKYPLVCITGMESDMLTKLLTNTVFEMEDDPALHWLPVQSDPPDDCKYLEIRRLDRSSIGDSSSAAVVVEVRMHRHLAFHGIRRILQRYCQMRIDGYTEVEKLRQEILGCRVAKDFGRDLGVYVGQVMSVDRTNPTSMDEDLYTVRYDDGDYEDYSITELYGKSRCAHGSRE